MASVEGGSFFLSVAGENDPSLKQGTQRAKTTRNESNNRTVGALHHDVVDIEETFPADHSNTAVTSSEGCSSSPTAALAAEFQHEEEGVQIAARETRIVFYLKLLVLAVLIVSALCVALWVYFYASNSEISAFETSFMDDANKVLDSLGSSIYLTLGAVDSFVVGLRSYAEYSNSTLPFVTLPDFAVRSSKILSVCDAVYFQHYPYITPDQRAEWEMYSTENDGWVDDGIDIQTRDDTYHGPIVRNYTTLPYVHDSTEDPAYADNNTGPYFPSWQIAPVIPRYPPYNWDLLSIIDQASILELMDSHKVVIGEAFMLPDPNNVAEVEENEYMIEWFSDFVEPDEDPSEPASDWYYPILDTKVDQVRIPSPKDETFVGMLAMSIYWRDMMKNILPSHSDGIIVVFENECNPTFTYQINGPEAVYLGRGDMHNSNYDHLQISSKLLDLNHRSARGERSYTGIPVNDKFCPFILHLYPSDTMKVRYVTQKPVVFTVSAVLIFAFTSCVFLIYDRLVERRQRKVMYTALQSRANISVLEDMVKDRTRSLEGTNRRLEEANRQVTHAAAAQLQHFACMSHEIRTPLNCIVGLSSLLEETELTPMQQESMRMIITSSDLLLTVVNDVLDYSKLESGNVDIEIRRINLQETLNSVVHSIESKGRAMNVSLSTKFDAMIGEFLHTDSRRVQQILYNLLGNALKFSREGGVIEVSLMLYLRSSIPIRQDSYSHGLMDADSSTSAKVDDHVLHIVVKDYGKGIARENFAKIFQPFSQASIDTERLYGGTGLGLAITAKLVKALGGRISVASEEGQWTEFAVDIPYNEDPVDIGAIAADLSNATVFLVCNEEEKANQVAGTLRQFNVEFAIFCDIQHLAAERTSQGELSNSRTYVCLVQEDLYDKGTYEPVFESVKEVLLTYGPNYSASGSLGHYRSLVQILPSVLMRSIASHVKASEQAKQEELVQRRSNTAASTVLYRKWRILIAEDNLVNQKVLLRILKRLGVENVEIVDNGKKAVEREAAEAFDLVLMDMQMPVMDGIEACRHIIRRRGGHPQAKVVFVTAHVQDSFESDCLSAGAVCFLPKPCNVRTVEDCLRKCADENVTLVNT